MFTEVKDILDNIVTISILDELKSVFHNLCNELSLLLLRGIVDTTLENTTTVLMSSNGNTMVRDGIIDELVVSRREVVETTLDHVVSIQVLDQSHNTAGEGGDDQADLLY